MNEFVTTPEMRERLGCSRQYIHQIIKSQEFETVKRGGIVMVSAKDWNLYLKRRLRRDLAEMAGRNSTKFLKTTEFDTHCPTCGEFAVSWKGTRACMNGHIIQED